MNRTDLFRRSFRFPARPLQFAISAAFVLLLLFPPGTRAAPASAAPSRDPFGEGSMRLSLVVGSGTAFDQNYFVAGAGLGYFISEGLELGLEGEAWSGAAPRLTKVSPQVRFVVPLEGSVKPYAGAFYRRTIVQGRDDLNSAGARAGLYFLSGRGGYFGAGLVYENYFSCNDTVFRSCTEAYPELMFAIVF